jgi:hypothetical protein
MCRKARGLSRTGEEQIGSFNAVPAIEVHPDFATGLVAAASKAEPLRRSGPGINSLRECPALPMRWPPARLGQVRRYRSGRGEMWWSCESGEQFRCWNLREPIAQLRGVATSEPCRNPRWTNERFRCERDHHTRRYVGIGVGGTP